MTQWVSSLLLLSSSPLTSHLIGWRASHYAIPPFQSPPQTPPPPSYSFPLNANQAWSIKSSLLIWRPYQDDMDSGFILTVPSIYPLYDHLPCSFIIDP